jgi:hypothetical protein
MDSEGIYQQCGDYQLGHICTLSCFQRNYKRKDGDYGFPEYDEQQTKMARTSEDAARLRDKAKDQVILRQHGFVNEGQAVMGDHFVDRAGIASCGNKSPDARQDLKHAEHWTDIEEGLALLQSTWFTQKAGQLLTNVLGRSELIAMIQTALGKIREQELIPERSKHLEYWDERFDENQARLFHILEYGHTWNRHQFEQAIEASAESKYFARWAVLETGAGNPDCAFGKSNYDLDTGAWENMSSVIGEGIELSWD